MQVFTACPGSAAGLSRHSRTWCKHTPVLPSVVLCHTSILRQCLLLCFVTQAYSCGACCCIVAQIPLLLLASLCCFLVAGANRGWRQLGRQEGAHQRRARANVQRSNGYCRNGMPVSCKGAAVVCAALCRSTAEQTLALRFSSGVLHKFQILVQFWGCVTYPDLVSPWAAALIVHAATRMDLRQAQPWALRHEHTHSVCRVVGGNDK